MDNEKQNNKSKLKDKIVKLEEEKKELIEQVKKYNKELKLRNIEYQAVKKLIEQGHAEDATKIIRRLKALEFKISTQALTPSVEKKYIKKVVELEKKLIKLKPYLNARKRAQFLEKEIENTEKSIEEIEEKLKEIRSELKELYKEFKLMKKASKSGVSYGQEKGEDMLTLEEIVEIEEKEK